MVRNQNKKTRTNCPLTRDKNLRAAADKMTASIKEGLPAGLSRPALRALASAGYTTLEQLAQVREADLAKLHGLGPKGIDLIRTALRGRGKSSRA
jgi:hypothetical protein